MNKRYQKIGEIDRGQYTVGSPIILVAGALLLDNQKKCVIGQLKFKNISEKRVTAIQVKIDAYDVMGEKLTGLEKFQYLDLNHGVGEYFGDRVAIELPDSNTRTLRVYVLNVCFDNGEVWNGENEEWSMLPKAEAIEGDPEYLKQYKIEFGPDAKFQFKEYLDLWQCVCGNYHKITRNQCTDCMVSKEKISHISESSIKEDIAKRLEEEEKADRGKRKSLILAIILCSVIVVAAIALFLFQKDKEERQYQDGVRYLRSEEYSNALEKFQDIGDYKDTAKYLEYCEILLELENLYDGEVHNMAEICRRIDGLENFQNCDELYDTNKELKYVLFLNGRWELESWYKGRGYFDEYEFVDDTYCKFENGVVTEIENGVKGESYEVLIVGYAHYLRYGAEEVNLKIKEASDRIMTVVTEEEDQKSKYTYEYLRK